MKKTETLELNYKANGSEVSYYLQYNTYTAWQTNWQKKIEIFLEEISKKLICQKRFCLKENFLSKNYTKKKTIEN